MVRMGTIFRKVETKLEFTNVLDRLLLITTQNQPVAEKRLLLITTQNQPVAERRTLATLFPLFERGQGVCRTKTPAADPPERESCSSSSSRCV
jgi:hypothetical protein